MTIIDFQIDAARFLAAQRSYLRRLALCPPQLPAVGGVQIVLDRVDIGPSSLRHDEPALGILMRDQLRRLRAVLGLEGLADPAIVDLYGSARDLAVAMLQLGASAPGQELRIALYLVHQGVHALGGIAYQHGLLDQRHLASVRPDWNAR